MADADHAGSFEQMEEERTKEEERPASAGHGHGSTFATAYSFWASEMTAILVDLADRQRFVGVLWNFC